MYVIRLIIANIVSVFENLVVFEQKAPGYLCFHTIDNQEIGSRSGEQVGILG